MSPTVSKVGRESEDCGRLPHQVSFPCSASWRIGARSHPKLGASWEGFVWSQIIGLLNVRTHECHFWATHAGAELDLLVARGRRRWGFEAKRTSAPTVTRSMRSALDDLRPQRLLVVHAGDRSFDMTARVRAVAISHLLDERKPW